MFPATNQQPRRPHQQTTPPLPQHHSRFRSLSFMVEKRQCVVCDGIPLCPPCAADETCQLTAQTCQSCAKTSCIKIRSPANAAPSLPADPLSGSPSKSGAIAGGVVGGVVAFLIVGFLVWRFLRRRRSSNLAKEINYNDDDVDVVDESIKSKRKSSRNTRRATIGRRGSSHTLASIASTVRTRASNIIPIAYVPGITNRSNPSSPDTIPPVPSLPPFIDSIQTHPFTMDDFMRGSTFTAPSRSSVATSYSNTAVIYPTTYTAVRAKPELIMLRSQTAPSGVPTINSEELSRSYSESSDSARARRVSESADSLHSLGPIRPSGPFVDRRASRIKSLVDGRGAIEGDAQAVNMTRHHSMQ